jgi:hypothetical protein
MVQVGGTMLDLERREAQEQERMQRTPTRRFDMAKLLWERLLIS